MSFMIELLTEVAGDVIDELKDDVKSALIEEGTKAFLSHQARKKFQGSHKLLMGFQLKHFASPKVYAIIEESAIRFAGFHKFNESEEGKDACGSMFTVKKRGLFQKIPDGLLYMFKGKNDPNEAVRADILYTLIVIPSDSTAAVAQYFRMLAYITYMANVLLGLEQLIIKMDGQNCMDPSFKQYLQEAANSDLVKEDLKALGLG